MVVDFIFNTVGLNQILQTYHMKSQMSIPTPGTLVMGKLQLN